mmetsp:Transcript_11547/g.17483  ORF Transcript_11547/g.17483 Transcript_11547/m.17483 type:complete len:80 (+) Transcript_11547:39-278(+)
MLPALFGIGACELQSQTPTTLIFAVVLRAASVITMVVILVHAVNMMARCAQKCGAKRSKNRDAPNVSKVSDYLMASAVF